MRKQAVQGQAKSGSGLTALIARGMAAFMQLLEQLPTVDKPQKLIFQNDSQPLMLLQETERQIVQLLASMVLERHQEVIHVR